MESVWAAGFVAEVHLLDSPVNQGYPRRSLTSWEHTRGGGARHAACLGCELASVGGEVLIGADV